MSEEFVALNHRLDRLEERFDNRLNNIENDQKELIMLNGEMSKTVEMLAQRCPVREALQEHIAEHKGRRNGENKKEKTGFTKWQKTAILSTIFVAWGGLIYNIIFNF